MAEHAFIWRDAERTIHFRAGVVADAPELLGGHGFERYELLTTERALGSASVALAEDAACFHHVPPGPVPEVAARLINDVGDDPLVALGGGRVIDAAKAIAGADGLECAAIPTTLSGAEYTRFHRMPAGVDEFRLTRPSLVLAEPRTMASQPMPELAASAMNALAHAIEALYTPMANPVASMAALRAAELIASGLEPEEPRRVDLALGAVLAGWASGTAGYAVHHVVCQTIVRVAGTPHAGTNAVVLPHSVRLMTDRAPAEIERLSRALGGDAAERVGDLSARAGATTLGELGFDASLADRVVAEAAARPEIHNTPRPPSEEDLRTLVEAAA